VREHRPFPLKRVYFVDNVITSGNTLEACAQALGFGTGLVYADASRI
jgi:predicted amidophosphoribosyltransferase